jgi:CCR4-NOT transcriptional complex subunit CAF120
MFPERLDVISQSNLMKVIGRIGGELVTIEGRLRDSGWALIMPEAQNEPALPGRTPLAHMMRLVTGFHDVFRLYGRPEGYNWNQQDPRSLFFAYPTGSERSVSF